MHFILTVCYCNLVFLSGSLGYFPHPLPILGEQISCANSFVLDKNQAEKDPDFQSSMQLQVSPPVFAHYEFKKLPYAFGDCTLLILHWIAPLEMLSHSGIDQIASTLISGLFL